MTSRLSPQLSLASNSPAPPNAHHERFSIHHRSRHIFRFSSDRHGPRPLGRPQGGKFRGLFPRRQENPLVGRGGVHLWLQRVGQPHRRHDGRRLRRGVRPKPVRDNRHRRPPPPVLRLPARLPENERLHPERILGKTIRRPQPGGLRHRHDHHNGRRPDGARVLLRGALRQSPVAGRHRKQGSSRGGGRRQWDDHRDKGKERWQKIRLGAAGRDWRGNNCHGYDRCQWLSHRHRPEQPSQGIRRRETA